MGEKYKNKYRIESARAVWWNYGWVGAYFITICTRNKIHFFGEIKNHQMILSPLGVLANVFWHEIPNHASNVELGTFVIMPNHVHGILIICPPDLAPPVQTRHALSLSNETQSETRHALSQSNETQSETRHALSLPPKPAANRFQNQGKNTVSSLVGSYKSAVTRHANRLGLEFAWQPRFHDHIIRNDIEYQRINDYIENNPFNWNDP
jgi:REP element-mobilizing transposase RayT